MSFETELAAYLQQMDVQIAMRQHIRTNGVGLMQSQVMPYVEEARDAIIESLPESLTGGSLHPITKQDLIIGPMIMNAVGEFEVTLSWNPKAIMRESIYQGDLGELDNHVENIVALHSTGTKPSRHAVFGYYKRKYSLMYDHYYIPQGYSRAANSFLRDAVAEFNARYMTIGLRLIAPAEYY